MLNDDVGHVVPVGVAVLVQAVHGAEHQLVVGQGSVLTPHRLHNTQTASIEKGKEQVYVSWPKQSNPENIDCL